MRSIYGFRNYIKLGGIPYTVGLTKTCTVGKKSISKLICLTRTLMNMEMVLTKSPSIQPDKHDPKQNKKNKWTRQTRVWRTSCDMMWVQNFIPKTIKKIGLEIINTTKPLSLQFPFQIYVALCTNLNPKIK